MGPNTKKESKVKGGGGRETSKQRNRAKSRGGGKQRNEHTKKQSKVK